MFCEGFRIFQQFAHHGHAHREALQNRGEHRFGFFRQIPGFFEGVEELSFFIRNLNHFHLAIFGHSHGALGKNLCFFNVGVNRKPFTFLRDGKLQFTLHNFKVSCGIRCVIHIRVSDEGGHRPPRVPLVIHRVTPPPIRRECISYPAVLRRHGFGRLFHKGLHPDVAPRAPRSAVFCFLQTRRQLPILRIKKVINAGGGADLCIGGLFLRSERRKVHQFLQCGLPRFGAPLISDEGFHPEGLFILIQLFRTRIRHCRPKLLNHRVIFGHRFHGIGDRRPRLAAEHTTYMKCKGRQRQYGDGRPLFHTQPPRPIAGQYLPRLRVTSQQGKKPQHRFHGVKPFNVSDDRPHGTLRRRRLSVCIKRESVDKILPIAAEVFVIFVGAFPQSFFSRFHRRLSVTRQETHHGLHEIEMLGRRLHAL